MIIVYHIFSTGLLLFLFIQLYRELGTRKNYFALFLISYAGLLTIFTRRNSPRYYIGLLVIVFVYMSFKLGTHRWGKFYAIGLSVISIISWSQLTMIYTQKPESYEPQSVTFGKLTETSAHFLPIAPVTDFLRNNKISHIGTHTDSYFIQEPVKFMSFIRPWEKVKDKKVIVAYNQGKKTGGFHFGPID